MPQHSVAFRLHAVAEGAPHALLLRIVNKHDLVQAMAKRLGVVEHQAEISVDSVLSLLGDALVRGETITLVGFGRFTCRRHRARTINRITDGERIVIPARLLPHYAPSPTLVRQVNARAAAMPPAPAGPDLFTPLAP